ncbi:L-threonylcarbamoyladenylate synthase [Facklamia hominis]|uniref:Threonylcarbamoyl-AMP synthase n=1 Tax=Facklamia hominis TaxID=178214 RepID=A0AAJ1Q4M2_9LACT|nr:L-threonylcarbamoyladenylate synthase [Facklamia hominis]EPH13303.1 Sua5/YciO/YrdC/YwlC family protein [Facklamia hominis ACS-120-V-Sch10]MDK7186779.1 L-threonylcarbamoyladenylate synthase [Facklamia hominis]
MKTKIFNQKELDQAAKLLQEGALVAFPTETVYGLGARCDQQDVVSQVYEVKGRPSDNPLIVHVYSQAQVADIVEEISPLAQSLMDHFWPGPLTIILPVKKGKVAPKVTGGKQTVAVRMPNNSLCLELLERVGVPLVGPSANLSGKPSPTQLKHVLHDFNGKIAGVVAADSRLTQIGVESTVVYPHNGRVDILRPGIIEASQIEQALKVEVRVLSTQQQLENQEVASPGVKYRHYAPKQPVYLISANYDLRKWQELLDQAKGKIALMVQDDLGRQLVNHPKVVTIYSLGEKGDTAYATRHLYDGLRQLEDSPADYIYLQSLENDKKSKAFTNRALKASTSVL